MRKVVRNLFRRVKFLFTRFPRLLKSLLKNKKLFDVRESYYPDMPHKSKILIFYEQLRQIIKWGAVEESYFLYGFDVKGMRNQDEYMSFGYHMNVRNYMNNHPSKDMYSYTGIMRDKFYFAIFMETLGFRVPKTFGMSENGEIYRFDNKTNVQLESLVPNDIHLICKPIDGWCGEGIFGLKIEGNEMSCDGEKVSMENLKSKFSNGKYFLQEYIDVQHPDMNRLYSKSINTLRITTVRDVNTGKIELMGCMMLMGARNAIVSNWHYGGVIIKIEDSGYLSKYGYSFYEKRITKHPDTGVEFESFKVPYFKEAIEEAKRCHEMFYGIHSVGWDFAIAPDGPIFIEANDNWGMAAHQMVDEGLVPKFNKYFVKH